MMILRRSLLEVQDLVDKLQIKLITVYNSNIFLQVVDSAVDQAMPPSC
jgi:hypothetical protein